MLKHQTKTFCVHFPPYITWVLSTWTVKSTTYLGICYYKGWASDSPIFHLILSHPPSTHLRIILRAFEWFCHGGLSAFFFSPPPHRLISLPSAGYSPFLFLPSAEKLKLSNFTCCLLLFDFRIYKYICAGMDLTHNLSTGAAGHR